MRYVFAGLLSLPVAMLFGVNGALMVAWGERGQPVMSLVGPISWAIVVIIAGRELSARRVFGRTAVAASIAGFALPISTFIGVVVVGYIVISGEQYDVARVTAGFGTVAVGLTLVGIASVIGILIGGVSALAAYLALRRP